MSQESTGIVRKPLAAREQSRRTLDQRVFMRFPGLAAASARLIGRLPPGSRIREAAIWRANQLAVEAYNRRDLDAFAITCDPEFEYHPARIWVDAGLVEPAYRGLEGYRRYVAATAEVWANEVYVKPRELIDLGDRVVMLADVPMRAQVSGVPLTEAFALVITLRRGRAIRLQEYFDHAEALEAVGLEE
jgi:ketosteroid isomerase-like protein